MNPSKPERLGRKTIYESPWVNLYLDRVRFPNGRIIDEYHLLDFPRPAVAALVEDSQGRLVFVRVPRYPTGQAALEIPAGGVEDGESVYQAACREVREETGYTSGEFKLLYTYYPMDGSANKIFHIVAGIAFEKVQEPDPDEVSEVRWLAKAEILGLIQRNEILDGLSLTGLLLWLQQRSA